MHTEIHPTLQDSTVAGKAQALINACVHCGFCNATCPTYLELADERDGPRGRIYLIRQLLENGTASTLTQRHLDRCLTCRNCETTCPSGVQYGRLLDAGRELLEQAQRRSAVERLKRWLLVTLVSVPGRFRLLLGLARLFAPLLPPRLRQKIPARQRVARTRLPARPRTMLALQGCAQAAATPNTNAAAGRVLDRLGITLRGTSGVGCCGALHYHNGDQARAKALMRRNIDAWKADLDAGAEAIAVTASGCACMISEYGDVFADDPDYAEPAQQVAAAARDIAAILAAEDLSCLQPRSDDAVAVHCPCTLQHGLRLGRLPEEILTRLGFNTVETGESHLCCGSAGSYSLLQPELSQRLLQRKMTALEKRGPTVIATANVGCQLHLASAGSTPVTHWIELLDAACANEAAAKNSPAAAS